MASKEYGVAFVPPDEVNGPGKRVTEPLPSVLPDTAALGQGLRRHRRGYQIQSTASRSGRRR